MYQKLIYFDLKELVCKDVYDTYGKMAWSFFDSRLLITIDRLRELLGKPMYVNSWDSGGQYDERGFRCIRCSEVVSKIEAGKIYVSPHMTGQAIDFDVPGLVAEEVRRFIVAHKNQLPYPIRLEADVSWCHLDTRDLSDEKISFFKG